MHSCIIYIHKISSFSLDLSLSVSQFHFSLNSHSSFSFQSLSSKHSKHNFQYTDYRKETSRWD